MKKKYKKVEFSFGNIEGAITLLNSYKDKGELVYGVFNGQKLYSDIDDLDSVYKKITGKTKAEFDLERKAESDRYKEEQQKHKDSIPELTKEWIEKGNVILDEKYRKLWSEIVPIRLRDLYQGMELKCCLDIVIELNNDCSLIEAKAIIESQGHSGMSFGLVRAMVASFCDRGNDFASYVN